MKILNVYSYNEQLDIETVKGEDPPRGHQHKRHLVLHWRCDVCKCKMQHEVLTKPVYTEADILEAARAAFNLAFYECGCIDEQKEEESTGPVR